MSRVPQAEVAVADNAVAFVLRVLDPPSEADLLQMVAFEAAENVRVYLQPGGPETIAPLTTGAEPLHYKLASADLLIEFAPTDFVQINGALNEAMVERALEMLEVRESDVVLDLFCGLGNFSLPLARRASRVAAVERDAGLVERARANARRNGLSNVEFHTADLFKDVTGSAWARVKYDLVLVDPPRAGAREVLPTVAASGARRVVYISCHPGSLARDAGLLVREHGFRLTAAGVMDMFPHTAHVEAMAVFDR